MIRSLSKEPTTRLIIRAIAAQQLLVRTAEVLGWDLQEDLLVEQIRREISFPPEMRQAGLGLLSYFSEIVAQKYPDLNVAVTITQRADKVVLVIDTPDGRREVIEHELSNYALVISGRLQPEQYADTPAHALRLKHRLEIAELELRQTRELLQSERLQYGARILTLEEHSDFLRQALTDDRGHLRQVVERIQALSAQGDSAWQARFEMLIEALQIKDEEQRKQGVMTQLQGLRDSNPDVFEKLHKYLMEAAVRGAIGNWFYAILQAMARLA